MATDSDPRWPPIPKQDGHLFRSIVAGHSDPIWPPLEGVNEATLDNPFEGHYPLKKRLRRSEWQPGDYPCARSKRYYVFIMKKVSQPVRLLEASISGEGPSETILHRIEQVGLSWPLPPEIDEATLEHRLFPPIHLRSPRKAPNASDGVSASGVKEEGGHPSTSLA